LLCAKCYNDLPQERNTNFAFLFYPISKYSRQPFPGSPGLNRGALRQMVANRVIGADNGIGRIHFATGSGVQLMFFVSPHRKL
jgi:hypothetical protein